MKTQIVNATADYTGGNIYIYYGQLSDGNWFRATDGEEFIEICDSDTSVDAANYCEFYKEHSIETLIGDEYESFWNEMLLWIIHNAPEGNYIPDELEKRIIEEEVREEVKEETNMKSIIKNMINQAETEENYSLINYAKQIVDELATTINAPSNWRSIGEELANEYDESDWVYEEMELWNHKED